MELLGGMFYMKDKLENPTLAAEDVAQTLEEDVEQSRVIYAHWDENQNCFIIPREEYEDWV